MWWGWSLILPLQKGALRLPSRRRDLFSPWKREYWNSRRLRRLRRGGISLNPPPSPTRAPPSPPRAASPEPRRKTPHPPPPPPPGAPPPPPGGAGGGGGEAPAPGWPGGEELKTPVPEQAPPLF